MLCTNFTKVHQSTFLLRTFVTITLILILTPCENSSRTPTEHQQQNNELRLSKQTFTQNNTPLSPEEQDGMAVAVVAFPPGAKT